MRPLTRGQIAFLALSCLALLLLGLTEPVIHGNDESSIRRYLQREMPLGALGRNEKSPAFRQAFSTEFVDTRKLVAGEGFEPPTFGL